MANQPTRSGVSAGAGIIGPGGAGPASPWAAITKLSTLDRVPVAGLLRVSQFQLQDVRGSLIRQVGNCTAKLPAGWEIVVWFIDIESGRMELDERGEGNLHLLVDLPVERAGGLKDLLEESKRRDCRFAAVICENTERLARVTYFGTKVEHELARQGIEVFAADEGIEPDGKKAAKVLMRRMKQAIGEFHALNVMEQAWDGLTVHTQEGYNIGRPPYGYVAAKEPHPAPARRSRGLTRSKLAVDPVRGPVVTQIFHWRVVDRQTFWEIANKLNEDPDRYPVPKPTRPGTAVGVWTWSSVRTILLNPKYTGYMVWNRTTTRTGMTVQRKKKHRANPVEQWVWSEQQTHPELVSLDRFRAAQQMSGDNQGSRAIGEVNSHPATLNAYLLRGLLHCGHCGRRMQGSRNNGRVYYKCAGPRNTAGRRTRPDHPGTLYIREDALLPAVADLIAARVFGPDRQAHLAAQHNAEPRQKAERHARAIEAAGRLLDDITTRQDALMAELEETDPKDQTQATYRARIRQRYAELEQQREHAAARYAELIATQPVVDNGTPELLDAMPLAAVHLAAVPAPVQRRLFEALNLTIRIDNARRAHVRITLTTDTPGTTAGVVADIAPDAGDDPATTQLPSGGTMPSDLVIMATNRGDVLLTPMAATSYQDPLAGVATGRKKSLDALLEVTSKIPMLVTSIREGSWPPWSTTLRSTVPIHTSWPGSGARSPAGPAMPMTSPATRSARSCRPVRRGRGCCSSAYRRRRR